MYTIAVTKADRSRPCKNRNGQWPPLYERQFKPLPPRTLDRQAQKRYQRHVIDAIAAGELHRTTAEVLQVFLRHSSDRLDDVWVAQATVGDILGLDEDTVNGHVAILKASGWLQVQHRNKVVNGQKQAMSNVTRFTLPDQWLERDEALRRSGQRQAGQNAAATRRGRHDRRAQHDPREERRPQPPMHVPEPRPVRVHGDVERAYAMKMWGRYDGDYRRCVEAVETKFAGDPNAINQAVARLDELARERPG